MQQKSWKLFSGFPVSLSQIFFPLLAFRLLPYSTTGINTRVCELACQKFAELLRLLRNFQYVHWSLQNVVFRSTHTTLAILIYTTYYRYFDTLR